MRPRSVPFEKRQTMPITSLSACHYHLSTSLTYLMDTADARNFAITRVKNGRYICRCGRNAVWRLART